MPMEKIEKLAVSRLKKHGLLDYPVDLESLLEKEQVQLHNEPLEPEISGMLITKGGQNHILVNSKHAETRRRFTMAHELGHLNLHHQSNKDSLFVDKQYMVYWRAGASTDDTYQTGSSTTTPRQEREANYFAGALLMPSELINKYLKRQKIDTLDDAGIGNFAKAFNVSEQAATIRLIRLRLIED